MIPQPPIPCMTVLLASVAPEVKNISSGSAPSVSAIVSLDLSTAFRA